MRIVVASKNQVKLDSVKEGFRRLFPNESIEIGGVSALSGVRAQPMDSEETLAGAQNRISHCAHTPADFWVSIEGGVEETKEGVECFAWIVIKNTAGKVGKAKTGVFFLPQKVVDLIHQGVELGHADDIVFGRTNSKEKNGAVGLLTNNVIDRKEYYVHAVVLALIPFVNENLF